MFNFKPKKVFEKINKMDRKQAYTIGAIAVVLVIALLLLISAATSGDDDSFAGMKARGYDLAQMPFATDEAEKYLLANAYPDMKENGSTLLYSAAEKEQRQEEDAEAAEEASGEEEMGDSSSDNDEYTGGSSSRGYGGYAGGGGSGRGKTEIGQLSSTGMASASGSGVSSTWGPSGDFHQFKGREDRGNGAPVELKTADGRRAVAQFLSGSVAAARIKENKLRNTGKSVIGGDIRGSDAFGKDGAVDLSKLQSGGLTLDTDAPATTTDLSNLDKKVADAAKKAEDDNNKDNDKKEWWEEMLINLAKSAAETLVNSFMGAVGDTISGSINGKQAQYAARKAANTELYNDVRSTKSFAEFQEKYPDIGLTRDQYEFYHHPDTSLKDTYKRTNRQAFSYQDDAGNTVTIGAGKIEAGKSLGYTNSPGHEAYIKRQQETVERNADERAARQQREHEEKIAKANAAKAEAEKKAAEAKGSRSKS